MDNAPDSSSTTVAIAIADLAGEHDPELLLRHATAVLGKTFTAERPRQGSLPSKRSFPLLAHLIDTAQTGGRFWDTYMPDTLRSALDRVTCGEGRRCFMWLCGVHDWGKATVAWALGGVGEAMLSSANATRLMIHPDAPRGSKEVPHAIVTRRFLNRLIRRSATRREADWILYVLEGHHGWFSSPSRDVALNPGSIGDPGSWGPFQGVIPEIMARLLGYESALAAIPTGHLPIAMQLSLTGWVIAADRVASNLLDDEVNIEDLVIRDRNVHLNERLKDLSFASNEACIERIWVRNGLDRFESLRTAVTRRPDSHGAHPLLAMIERRTGPALYLVDREVEADTLWEATRRLGSRFGLRGLYVGVPDDQQRQVWSARLGTELTASGLPGTVHSITDEPQQSLAGAAFFNRFPDRQTLLPVVVDRFEPLLTAVQLMPPPADGKHRTKRIRSDSTPEIVKFAGIAGKVVAVKRIGECGDTELRCLRELLMWLGSAATPVILEAAGLHSDQRALLAGAYLRGLTERYPSPIPDGLDTPGAVTAVFAEDGAPHVITEGEPASSPPPPRSRRSRCDAMEAIESRLLSRPLLHPGAWPPRTLKGLYEP